MYTKKCPNFVSRWRNRVILDKLSHGTQAGSTTLSMRNTVSHINIQCARYGFTRSYFARLQDPASRVGGGGRWAGGGGAAVSAVCLVCSRSSYMFTNTWEYELAQGGPHSSAEPVSLSLHRNPAVLSMQMRRGRGGRTWSAVFRICLLWLLQFK